MKKHFQLIHLELKDANNFVEQWHRHHKSVQGHRFSIGVVKEYRENNLLVGVAIVGRPVARAIDYKTTVEITRLCTDGTSNACSFLYSASARAAKALGYAIIQTYILASEPGTSLKAAGWYSLGQTRKDGKGWNNRKGRRNDQPTEPKIRWIKTLC